MPVAMSFLVCLFNPKRKAMSSLRVIAGTARGMRLRAVPGDSTRPITDRTKESLFNIIGADIIDSTFLDLFAGTGAVAIEALSRGARSATLVDINTHAIETIRKNLQTTLLKANARVIKSDAFRILETFQNECFDYIYVAPPQYQGIWKQAMQFIDKNSLIIEDDGWVIVQIHPSEYEDLSLSTLVEFDQRKYGSTRLVFYRRPI